VSGTGITERTIGPILFHDPADDDDYAQASDVSFTPSGSGASSRTAQAKMRDIVSLKDWDVEADGTTNDTTAVQACFDSGADEIYVPDGTYLIGDVNLPTNVTLRGGGGKFKFVLGSTASGINCASGSKILGVRFNVGGADSLGTSATVDIEGADVTIADCHFEGETGSGPSNFKFNYTIRISNTADCSGAQILNNRFKNTYSGVIRQSGSTGLANRMKIIGNDFSGVDKGDAIELNIGADVGIVIANNTINDVSQDSISNAGIAIGIAGDDSLSGPEADEMRRFIVTGNYVNSAEMGIHIEGCNNFLVANNVVSSVTGASGSEGGIQCYGCSEFVIQGNHTFANTIAGIRIGAESTDESHSYTIQGNTCVDESRGIYAFSDEASTLVSIIGNTIINASTLGIDCTGGANWAILNNTTFSCTGAFRVDLDSASNRCHLGGNFDSGSTTKFALANASSAVFTAQGNGDICADTFEIKTIAADSTTFDARSATYWITSANTGATALTAITGRKGQVVKIRGGSATNATTIADSGNFRLSAAATLTTHFMIELLNIDGSTWVEQSRSSN
jgi:parallel beta-helix repeat protein